MNNTSTAQHLPTDVGAEIAAVKKDWRQRIHDVPALLDQIVEHLESDIDAIEREHQQGKSAWPEVDFKDIEQGSVDEATLAKIKRRGCVVVRNHFPVAQAQAWDQSLIDYVDSNNFDQQYRGPGDNFFGSLSASKPEIYPIYWSGAQMEARQSERMATVQCFLNSFWKAESEGKTWFDPNVNYIYPDRVRRRPPGTNSNGLGPHTDAGSLERWLVPAYQQVFRHIINDNFAQYDPWDGAYRSEVNEYACGTTRCSVFRTFQGWTALSDIKRDQGVLFSIPIPAAMAYVLIRPLMEDVPDTSLCGVAPRQALPVDAKWHDILLRGKSTIPDMAPGDSVWWHCDLIHGVAPVKDQQGWGNVMYIPAAPGCEKNKRYAQQCAKSFATGLSPDDFPEEHYEKEWGNRFRWEDLNAIGRQSFGE